MDLEENRCMVFQYHGNFSA